MMVTRAVEVSVLCARRHSLLWFDLTWYGLNWAVVQIALSSLIDSANELLSKDRKKNTIIEMIDNCFAHAPCTIAPQNAVSTLKDCICMKKFVFILAKMKYLNFLCNRWELSTVELAKCNQEKKRKTGWKWRHQRAIECCNDPAMAAMADL